MRLLQLLLESILEAIIKKDLLGKGAHKVAYPALKYNDVRSQGQYVIKKWKNNDVVNGIIKREYDVYKNNPDMFAYISMMDFNRNIMVQKKLDTNKAVKELEILKKELEPYYKLDTQNYYTQEEYADNVLMFIETMVEDGNIGREVLINITDKNTIGLLQNWMNFIKRSNNMNKGYTDRFNVGRTLYPDLHSNNVGYDSDGKIKYIDI